MRGPPVGSSIECRRGRGLIVGSSVTGIPLVGEFSDTIILMISPSSADYPSSLRPSPSRASFHLQRRLLGHASRDESDTYGAPAARLEELSGALTAALPHLGDVDESIYSEAERLNG